MPKLIGLLIAVMLTATSLAQNTMPGERIQFQGAHPRPKVPPATLAHKLVVLQKGRPLSEMDKRIFAKQTAVQFRTMPVMRLGAPAPQLPRPMVQSGGGSSGTYTITPDQMVTNGLIGAAYGVAEWDPADGGLLMTAGSQNFVGLQVIAQPNTMYVLTVRAQTWSQAPHFTITPMGANGITSMPGQSVTGSPGTTEFAFAFDTTGSGSVTIDVSGDSNWMFVSAELIATPE